MTRVHFSRDCLEVGSASDGKLLRSMKFPYEADTINELLRGPLRRVPPTHAHARRDRALREARSR